MRVLVVEDDKDVAGFIVKGLREAGHLHGRGLIQLGLLLLITTPVARVLFSVLAFLYEKDWTYVGVTVIVLGLLSYSLFFGS